MGNKSAFEKARSKLIVALDVDSKKEALELIKKTSTHVGFYKIGLQLFTREGPQLVKELTDEEIKIFLDLKLHDIPNTVASTARMIATLGVSMFTVHCFNGPTCLEICKRELSDFCKKNSLVEPTILGVTVLTSMTDSQLQAVGVLNNAEREVEQLSSAAYRAGIRGFVSSPREISLLKNSFRDIFLVTPGVRPRGTDSDDQKRIATPSEAVLWGADAIVVGRPITRAEDPSRAAKNIVEEIASIL